MKNFNYHRLQNSKEISFGKTSKFLAGGTTLIDLMKLEVETPTEILDINGLALKNIEPLKDGGLRIGALVKNSDLAHDPLVKKNYSVLSQALLSGASAQLRNKATTAGNLLQRTRCSYFRDISKPCNKRSPGSGCSAIEGINRNLAILGTSSSCIATNPSDMNVALMALGAKIQILTPGGQERETEIEHFYLLPQKTPHLEHDLAAGELITSITLPAMASHTKSYYLKLRDRASYEFALSSAAVIATVQDGHFQKIRIALGGVGTIPWRAKEAEEFLIGKPLEASQFRLAAEKALEKAQPQSGNAFKVELTKRCLTYALKQVTKEGRES